MINVIKGDIFNSSKDEIIVHQVNCKGVMGVGLALNIKNKYPEVFISYMRDCKSVKGKSSDLLGSYRLIETSRGDVINVFAQDDYGRDGRYTRYPSLIQALIAIREEVLSGSNKGLAIPYGIGCGLAGGDWDKVMFLITTIFEGYEDRIRIYKLK